MIQKLLQSPWLVLVMWLVCTFNFVTMVQSRAAASVAARATITRYQPASDKHPAFIEYSYEIDGKAYRGSFNGSITATTGEIDIWYNPDTPDQSVLVSPRLVFRFFVGGYLLLSFGFLGVVGALLRARARRLSKARQVPAQIRTNSE